jgi:tetratricopeptide (TPR) repeat protein
MTVTVRKLLCVYCFGLGLVMLGTALTPMVALAFGGDRSTKPYSCPKGKAWDGKKCVKTSKLDDKHLIEQGRQLAVSGLYAQAISVLNAVRDNKNPLALTYLGYSYRKSGQFKRGMSLYKQALSIDPESIVTREYLGEGYAEMGRVHLARLELAKVEKLCGNVSCEEYRDLAEAIKHSAHQSGLK